MGEFANAAGSCFTMRAHPSRLMRANPQQFGTGVFIAAALSLAGTAAANAGVTISSAATSNMSCSRSVCAPTARKAILNVGDLETLLGSGNVEVTTTGARVQADNIEVDTPLSWSSTETLALDAYQSIRVEKPVTISGLGGLSITTNDGGNGGYFGFGAKGHITFANLSSTLTINGASYTLEGNIKSLAAAIAVNSAGNYAFANRYDAGDDGTYENSPIPTEFSGTFEGLGNTISNLSLNGSGDPDDNVGLFAELALNNQPGGAVENISLQKLKIQGNGFTVGGLVGFNLGTVSGAFAGGTASSNFQQGSTTIGILVGINYGAIMRSGALGTIKSDVPVGAGGLTGDNEGTIVQSYADAEITCESASYLGSLSGLSGGPISQSFGIGEVRGDPGSYVGGLVGLNESTIAQTYSTTALQKIGHKDRQAGGLIGVDDSEPGSISSSYWDTTTSHINSSKKGAGTPKKDPGITGRTTEQLQSGVPSGFDPTVWAEDPEINDGLPYLIANPPEK